MMANSKALQDQLEKLSLEASSNPSDAYLILDYAKILHQAGKFEEAFREIKKAVSMRSKDAVFMEKARAITHELMANMSTSSDKYSPGKLLVLVSTAAQSEINSSHLESAAVLLKFCKEPQAAGQLLKMNLLSIIFDLLLSNIEGKDVDKFVSILSQCGVHFLKNSPENVQVSDNVFKLESITILKEFKVDRLSPFFELLSSYLQKVPDKSQQLIDFVNDAISQLWALNNLDTQDVLVSLLLRIWPSKEFADPWILNIGKLEQLLQVLLALVEKKKLQFGHVSVMLGKLNQACFDNSEEAATFRTNLLKLCRKNFERDESGKYAGIFLLQTLFMVNVQLAGSIFIENGILNSIIDCLEFEKPRTQEIALNLLSEACADPESRKKIQAECMNYLNTVSKSHDSLQILATSILAKLSAAEKKPSGIQMTSSVTISEIDSSNSSTSKKDLAKMLLIKIVDETEPASSTVSAIEGLSYLSSNADVKELIQKFPNLISRLEKIMKTSTGSAVSDSSVAYGIASLLDNVTMYKIKRSEEEEQVQKLREYCKDALPSDKDVRNSDKGVAERNMDLVHKGIIKLLLMLSSKTSKRVIDHVCRTWMSLATDTNLRGILAQGGAIRCLLLIYKAVLDDSATSMLQTQVEERRSSEETTYKEYAAQAIAKISISLDPHIAFPSSAPNMIKPLLDLLETHNQLFQFEALLALTNLASMDEQSVGEVATGIRRKFADKNVMRLLEDRILSDHPRIQCATTELLCNLMGEERAAKGWIQERGATRMKILLALSDADEKSLRIGATGALAMLLQLPEAVKYAFEYEKIQDVLMRYLEEVEDEDVLWRCLFIWNVLCQSEETARMCVKDVKVVKERILKCAKSSTKNRQVQEYANGLLSYLRKHKIIIIDDNNNNNK